MGLSASDAYGCVSRDRNNAQFERLPLSSANSNQTVLNAFGARLVYHVTHAYQATDSVFHVLKNFVAQRGARKPNCGPSFAVGVDFRALNNADLLVCVVVEQ